jgi:hypothetical protein
MQTHVLEVPPMLTNPMVPICVFIIIAAFVVILLTARDPFVAVGCYLLGFVFGTVRLYMRQP